MKKHLLLFILALISWKAQAQWIKTNGPEGGSIKSIVTDGTHTFAATTNQVYLSTNNGGNWTAVNNGLPNVDSMFNIKGLAMSGNYLYAATYSGIYLTSDYGVTWVEKDSGIVDKVINSIDMRYEI